MITRDAPSGRLQEIENSDEIVLRDYARLFFFIAAGEERANLSDIGPEPVHGSTAKASIHKPEEQSLNLVNQLELEVSRGRGNPSALDGSGLVDSGLKQALQLTQSSVAKIGWPAQLPL